MPISVSSRARRSLALTVGLLPAVALAALPATRVVDTTAATAPAAPPAPIVWAPEGAGLDIERVRSSLAPAGEPLAQFQLPPDGPVRRDGRAIMPLPSDLTYQYSWSTETSLFYNRDRDLDRRVRDNTSIMQPNINGIFIWRPTRWLESTLELIVEREVGLQQEQQVVLPNGEIQRRPHRGDASVLVDQAYLTFRRVIAPFELSVGRRNYEDERRSIYDTSMDMVNLTFRQGTFRSELMYGREHLKNLELSPRLREQKDRNTTGIFYNEYRGIEDMRIAGWFIHRDDRTGREGRPKLYGSRVLGTPSAALSYWVEGGVLRGKDENQKHFRGWSYDTGVTYRFRSLPLNPNITIGYAFGSGDGDPNDTRNHEFRNSGFQAHEWRFAGVTQFKVLGEALDPELNNIKIWTFGVGVRPTAASSLDVVYHRYKLDKLSDTLRGTAITAQMAQYDADLRKEIGHGVDIVLGLRNILGFKRLGLDLRVGWLLPGKAFLTNVGTDERPIPRYGDRSTAIVVKLWY